MTSQPPSPDQNERLHAVVSGDVQGVGFRAYVQEKADLIGVTGWVRNWVSGEVEVVAEGTRPALEDLLAYLKRGPRSAHVDSVRTEWQPATGEFDTFHVVRTWPS